MEEMRIAVSGDPGSFSEEAGLLYAQREHCSPDLVFATDMEGALQSMDSGEVEYALFPVVNSRGGLVRPAFVAMGRYSFEIVSEVWLEVYQCLMVRTGVRREDVRKITSHSQAIAQCERYIKREFPRVGFVEWSDTARAAKDLAEGNISLDSAVIAPARAAYIYGLEILDKGIQDNHPNLTTFIVVRKPREI